MSRDPMLAGYFRWEALPCYSYV